MIDTAQLSGLTHQRSVVGICLGIYSIRDNIILNRQENYHVMEKWQRDCTYIQYVNLMLSLSAV